MEVSLFTREWIEIIKSSACDSSTFVSLFTREWIEIYSGYTLMRKSEEVSLFTREWIEIAKMLSEIWWHGSLPLYEGVDWNTHIV